MAVAKRKEKKKNQECLLYKQLGKSVRLSHKAAARKKRGDGEKNKCRGQASPGFFPFSNIYGNCVCAGSRNLLPLLSFAPDRKC